VRVATVHVSGRVHVQSRMITSLLGDPRFSWQDRF
jgi:hypothetical protein